MLVAALAAVLASSVLLFLGTGLHDHWPLMWFATLPVLLIAPRVSAGAAFAIAAISWFGGTLNMGRYLRHILVLPFQPHAGPLVMPVGAAVGLLIVPSCIFGLAVLLWRGFARGGALGRAALALPAVWVTCEYLNAVFSPHGTFGNLAYSQMDCLPVLQTASVLGVWGISFCLFFFPAAVAALASGRGSVHQKRAMAAGAGVALVAVLVFGWWRLHFTPAAEHTVVVGLAASDLPRNVVPEEPEAKGRLFRDYAEKVETLAGRGAQVVILPEKLGVVVDPETREIDALFQNSAARGKAAIVLGVIRRSADAKLNEARFYAPDGGAAATYEKHHMLPAFESSFLPGTARTLVREPSGVWGIAICKDMDFPLLGRQYARDGASLLLVPAWDFGDDGWLHGRMAVMRGVESGFSLARAPKEGLLTLSDDRGRILAEQSSGAAPFASVLAAIPIRSGVTLYARFGDWFAWLNIGILVVLLVAPSVRRLLRKHGEEE
jgi:apolipoprotein N-acyltransferase